MNFSADKFLEILRLVGSRYFILASIAFFICYVILRNRIANKKIQLHFPESKDYLREMAYSFSKYRSDGFQTKPVRHIR